MHADNREGLGLLARAVRNSCGLFIVPEPVMDGFRDRVEETCRSGYRRMARASDTGQRRRRDFGRRSDVGKLTGETQSGGPGVRSAPKIRPVSLGPPSTRQPARIDLSPGNPVAISGWKVV